MRDERLITNSSVVVRRVEHDEEYVPHSVQEEICDHFAINFVDSGEFELGVDGKLRAGDAFICRPGVRHTFIHHDDVPADVCLAVNFTGALAMELERSGWIEGIRRASSNIAFLRHRLTRIVADDDSMRLEEWAGEVVGAVRAPIPRSRWHRQWQLDLYSDRIEMIRRLITATFADGHTLISLASEAGMSPFHFARVFRELVGTPPHRYLCNIRLERASAMLRDGAPVTTTCYDVGFSNLSHFIRSFRRRFGCAPSELRKKVQANGERRPA